MARVSGTVDTMVDTTGKTMQVVLEEVTQVAIARAVTNGAKQETVSVAEIESIPLQVCIDLKPSL
jgi:hypoxanthine phosphoribosyltransferase